MAKKTTIMLDVAKIDVARSLVGARTVSATIDLALAEFIRSEQIRRDVAAYSAVPPSVEEVALSRAPIDWSDLSDDTDWAALYEDDAV